MVKKDVFLYPKEWVTEEDETLADSVRDWADKEVMPNRQEFDEDYEDKLVGPAMKKLFVEIGLQKMVWPEKYGGEGLNTPAVSSMLVRVLEEISRADSGIGFIFANTFCSLLPIILEPDINDELCSELAPLFCKSNDIKTVSLILPDFGDPEIRTDDDFYGLTAQVTAELRDDGVILNGRNVRPINSGSTANMFGVISSAGDGDLLYVLVPENTSGIKRGKTFFKTGLNSDKNADLSFDKIKLPKKYVVWKGSDMKVIKEILSWKALCDSALCVGSIMDVYETAKRWGTDRVIHYDQTLKENPLVASVYADVSKDIVSSRLLTHNLARILAKPEIYGESWNDAVFSTARSISLTVMNASCEAINKAMETMASEGYAREGDIEKHWRDVKSIKNMIGGEIPAKMDVTRYFFECKNI